VTAVIEIERLRLRPATMDDVPGAVLAHAFTTWSLDRVIAVVKHDNIASQRVAERAGLVAEGERHAYDELMLLYAAYP
jgi:RimJ/RimL family protein N-acetyltransferase